MQSELVAAKARNPAFSLRAFARRIGLYSSTVSEILGSGRAITPKMGRRILEGLGTPPVEAAVILEALSKRTGVRDSKLQSSALQFAEVTMDQFTAVSDWRYFAILSLADTHDFQGKPEWVASRLGIKRQEATVALKRLVRLGMLLKKPGGKYAPTGKQFDTPTDIANLSLRKHHYQNLDLARRSLDEDELLKRDFSFINMAVDPAKLPEVKRRIREFRNELCAFFESGKRKEVYKMCIQLFPLTKE